MNYPDRLRAFYIHLILDDPDIATLVEAARSVVESVDGEMLNECDRARMAALRDALDALDALVGGE